ncbi:hypothetical protein PanWU01x14_134550 [Parasponia andersonii]|uniref:Uncharacterized protein n=1 Tax=Parasponia andersonii TaxID=3476 RepID=A0A2P5CPP3_PARAD|nr:hypothetical protein PanWU01x14_134550 [Parasponia andersonii]
MNVALMAKWSWQLLSGHKSLCCDVLRAKDLKSMNFADASYRNSDYWFWKLVIKARHWVLKVACKAVGHGRSINVWTDPCVPFYLGFRPTPMGVERRGFVYAADFVTELRLCFDQEAVSAICKIDVGNETRPDRWIWTKDANGEFSTKSAYLLQALNRAPSQPILLPKEWTKLCATLESTKGIKFYGGRFFQMLSQFNLGSISFKRVCKLLRGVVRIAVIHNQAQPDVSNSLRNEMMLATVARDHNCLVLFAATCKVMLNSALAGETQAAILALTEPANRKLQFCIVEGDSQLAISNLNGDLTNWEVPNSVGAAKDLCNNRSSIRQSEFRFAQFDYNEFRLAQSIAAESLVASSSALGRGPRPSLFEPSQALYPLV